MAYQGFQFPPNFFDLPGTNIPSELSSKDTRSSNTPPAASVLSLGFCGESGHAACNIYLQIKKNSATVEIRVRRAWIKSDPMLECPNCLWSLPEHADRGERKPRTARAVERRLPHAVWGSMELSLGEELGASVPLSKIPAPFSRLAGPDAGVDATQRLGVRRVPVSTTAPGVPRPRKKQKGNSGAAVAKMVDTLKTVRRSREALHSQTVSPGDGGGDLDEGVGRAAKDNNPDNGVIEIESDEVKSIKINSTANLAVSVFAYPSYEGLHPSEDL
ncbi:hypothetical protein C8R44DRAFT_725273 [Mycena epipterygia]|nr:hypothetical protein C8R44DRAFT_725273 [Mycena epipterygia]